MIIILSSYCKTYLGFIFFILFISIISIILYINICSQDYYEEGEEVLTDEGSTYYFSNSEFYWPLPGYHKITSLFGKRVSPTTGASSNHSGIDIAAPEGTNIFAVRTGKVIFVGFNGAGGYTITVESNNFNISYCHVSPNFIVNVRKHCKCSVL